MKTISLKKQPISSLILSETFIKKITIKAFVIFLSTLSLFSCKKNEPTQKLPTAQSLKN